MPRGRIRMIWQAPVIVHGENQYWESPSIRRAYSAIVDMYVGLGQPLLSSGWGGIVVMMVDEAVRVQWDSIVDGVETGRAGQEELVISQ